MRLRTIDTFPDELDDVARRSPGGTFYHTSVWVGSLSTAFPRMTFRCLVAERNGNVVAYLPYFILKKGPLRAAWSMPFGTYGGPVAEDEDVAQSLLREYTRVADGTGFVEAGFVDFTAAGERPGWMLEPCETHLVDISGGFELLWSEGVERQRKKRMRRAERMGVTVERTTSPDDVRSYYRVYRSRLEQWGQSLAYPERLFHDLLERGGDSVRFYAARQGGTFLGGHFNFCYKDTVTSWNGVTSIESHHLQPDTMLYLSCIREACDERFRLYNLGSSLDKQSLIDYKESLGGRPHAYGQYRKRSFAGRVVARLRKLGGR
jgi:CelD/BcsL family acetyltransferase involved in cellulose biosynthesis